MSSELQRVGASDNVLPLVIGNSLGISVAVASVTISALSAQSIGWEGARATLPYGGQFLFTLLATLPAPGLMNRFGRNLVFQVATFIGLIGSVLCAFAVEFGQPMYLIVGHCLIGVALAAVNLFRFAALDIESRKNNVEGMSLVVFGGSVAAFLGPSLVRYSNAVIPQFEQFSATYLGMGLFCTLIGALLFKMPAVTVSQRKNAISWVAFFSKGLNAKSLGGILTAAIGYGVMNLLMVSGSIAMSKAGFPQQHITTAIQFHVLAMFVPSIFMGRIMSRYTPHLVVLSGGIVSILSMTTAILMPVSVINFYASLTLAGLAWNMLYIGGSYVATSSSSATTKYNTQSLNEIGIGVFAVSGAFLPGLFMSKLDWEELNLFLILPVMLAHLFGFFLIFRVKDR